MPRVARATIPGAPHHVTSRGNNRQAVLFRDDDRRVYLALLREREEQVRAIRANTRTGRPLGSDSFLSKLEHALGRRLRPGPSADPEGKWPKEI